MSSSAVRRLEGRVVALDASGFTLSHDGVNTVIDGPPPPLGCYVAAEVEFVEGRVRLTSVDVVSQATESFARGDSDWSWVHGTDAAPRREWLHVRARVLALTRQFFDERDFVEVDTPLAVRSPGLDVHLGAFELRTDDEVRFLITSPEYQMKRLLSAGMPRIYQLGHAFRTDEQGGLHEPEFTMLEWYRSFSGMNDLMRDTEELVTSLAEKIASTRAARVESGTAHLLCVPWARLTVAEAFERHASIPWDEAMRDEGAFFHAWIHDVEPHLGYERPTFVTHFPEAMASLARLSKDIPGTAERFELYVRGIELCNGFGELTDPVEQRERLLRDVREREERALPPYPIDERFLRALEDGTPPSGGNALGFDRLLLLLVGATRIEDVIWFPRSRL